MELRKSAFALNARLTKRENQWRYFVYYVAIRSVLAVWDIKYLENLATITDKIQETSIHVQVTNSNDSKAYIVTETAK